jgi:phenylpropionate dioxygenase-like ring-hydroxylating dioxygenase large terminal subunit
LIRNQWYIVMESGELKSKTVGARRLGENLVFYRSRDGKAVCMSDLCAHRGASLALGELKGHDRIMCPFHGLEYAPDGRCVKIPANGKDQPVPPNFRVVSYPVHESHGFISIWWGLKPPVDLAPPPFFDDLPGRMKWATVRDYWKTHYSRVIENQLDCVHVPFVHRKTIGRGNRTLVNGPGIEWVSRNRFFMYVSNAVDNGQKPQTCEEVPIPSPNGYKIEFQFPNLWENRIAEKLRVLAAFVPVDGENTILYLRIYHGFLTLPVVRTLFGALMSRFNLKVAHEDRRIVETQVPKVTGLKIGENLFQGDKPIIEYRRRRQELMDEAGRG